MHHPEKKAGAGTFRLRKELQLFANLRPIPPLSRVLDASTIKADVLQALISWS